MALATKKIKRTSLGIISAVDDNPRYEQCEALFMRAWQSLNSFSEQVEFIPVVIRCSQDGTTSVSGLNVDFKLSESWQAVLAKIPSAFVAQNVRIPACALLPFDFAMASDIDMLPASVGFFENLVNRSNATDAVIVVRDVLGPEEIPICYNIARPRTWAEVFKIDSIESLCSFLSDLWSTLGTGGKYSGTHGGDGWNTDQKTLAKILHNNTSCPVQFLSDRETGHRRLDRSVSRWGILRYKIAFWRRMDQYSDFHIPLPVNENLGILNQFFSSLDRVHSRGGKQS